METFLQLGAAYTVVKILFGLVGEWRAARQLVPIANLTAATVAEHRCIPVQFAGSSSAVVGAAVNMWGFLVIGPKSRRQPYWMRRVVGIEDNREIDYENAQPGHELRLFLEGGEYPAAFDKALRRGGTGGYRTVAVRNLDDPESDAYCMTIRSRGRFARSAPDSTEPQWLQYEIVQPTPRSNRRSGRMPLGEVPRDAIQLILAPAASYQLAAEASPTEPNMLQRWALRYNSNFWRALGIAGGRYGAIGSVGFLSVAVFSGWRTALGIAYVGGIGIVLAIAALLVAVLIKTAQLLLGAGVVSVSNVQLLAFRSYLASAESQWLITSDLSVSPPRMWMGATTRCLSVGRVLTNTNPAATFKHLWRQSAPLLRPFTWYFKVLFTFMGIRRFRGFRR